MTVLELYFANNDWTKDTELVVKDLNASTILSRKTVSDLLYSDSTREVFAFTTNSLTFKLS